MFTGMTTDVQTTKISSIKEKMASEYAISLQTLRPSDTNLKSPGIFLAKIGNRTTN